MKHSLSVISKRMQHLSDDEVLANLGSVIGSRRKITAELVAYLGEVEARRLELREACSSMYEFCCRKLKLSEGSAHRNLAAARIARGYPMVLDLLREGRIHVTALSMLQRYLSVENHAELLAAACDKSKAEVELLIRSWFPRPDVADAIRLLPVQAHLGGDAAAASQSVAAVAGQSVAADSGPPPVEPKPRVSPLSAERFHIQFSAGADLKDKLERALDLMSHSNPKRDLATLIERGLDLVLEDLEKKKLGRTDRPRRSRGTKHGDFSREARREIYERDGEQCTYVSPSGERCRARAFVQLDHENPRACGGAGTTRNGRLLCGPHNLFEAEKVFGREYIDSRIRLRQQRLDRQSPQTPNESCIGDTGSPETAERDSIDGAIRFRQQQSGSESPHTPEETQVGGDADPPASIDSLSCEASNADETASTDPLSCRPSDAREPTTPDPRSSRTSSAHETASTDPPSCHVDVACELLASESLRSLQHAAGRAADLEAEALPAGEVRDPACVDSTDVDSKLVSALTNMGFRRRESKKAVVELACRRDTRGQGTEHLAALLRQALAILVP